MFLVSGVAHSKTWHVRQDGSGNAPTIQAAIDSSITGDTVLVAAGDYTTQGLIMCSQKHHLTILGEDATGPVMIRGTANQSGFMLDSSEYVTLRGFTFSNCPLDVNWAGQLVIEKNTFKDLSPITTTSGGGIEIRDNLVCSCGYGIYCGDAGTGISIHNNVITVNRGAAGVPDGCGICLDLGSFTIYNNIITNNIYGIVSIATTLSLSCNDVWGNQAFNYDLTFAPDPTGTNGNISADPQFCGVAPEVSGNFYLQSDSPCAPGNHPEGPICGVIGRYDIGCGTTAVKAATWGKMKSLFGR